MTRRKLCEWCCEPIGRGDPCPDCPDLICRTCGERWDAVCLTATPAYREAYLRVMRAAALRWKAQR